MDELNEGKMLYAGIKVMDPNTNLPKIVFINWVLITISINLLVLVLYRESVNLIGCITRRLSADSLQ